MSLGSPSANATTSSVVQSTTPVSASSSTAASASSISRTQRCGVCEGCLAKACGACVYCRDNPQFGGPGVKKQSCVARRCVRVLEGKLQREALSARAKKGCGVCDECRDSDCGACLVCMDKRFFQGHFLPDALCSKKKCSNARPLDPYPVSPRLVSSIATSEKKSRNYPHSGGPMEIPLSGSPRKTPAPGTPTSHLAHYGGSDPKRRKLDSVAFGPPAGPVTLRPTAVVQPVHSGLPIFAQGPNTVSLMERAFTYVVDDGAIKGFQPSLTSTCIAPLRHPTMLIDPRHNQGPASPHVTSGGSPPAGSIAPVYRNLPVATPVADSAHATWNPQTSKVLYPTSVQTFSSTAVDPTTQPSAEGGFIVTLDGSQLKQHLTGNSTGPWSSPAPPTAADQEDVELQQKLIEFYQRDKQQQLHQHHPQVSSVSGHYTVGHAVSGNGKHVGSLPPSIVVKPIAPMGQSEVVLQQL